MIQSCVPCRNRKVKCDGKMPKCGSCSKAQRVLKCTFERAPWTLCNGEACLPCRRRKRRCDAVRPACSTCQSSRNQTCIYDQSNLDSRFYQKDPDDTLREIEPQTRLLKRSRTSSSKSSSPEPEQINSSVPMDPALYEKNDFLQFNSFLLDFFQAFPPNSTISIEPATLLHQETPVFSPQVPFSSPQLCAVETPISSYIWEEIQDPSPFALSNISLDDLNMKFRLIFLSNRVCYGISLPFDKQQAILFGDLSGTFIHPFFIHFANLAGAQAFQEQQGHFGLLYIQALHLHFTLEAFHTMKEEDDPFALAQANFFMGMAYGHIQKIHVAARYLKRSVGIVRRNRIRFIPMLSGDETNDLCSLPPFSEEVHERAAFLAQMLYSEIVVYLLGQPGANLGKSPWESHLTDELPRLYNHLYTHDAADQEPETPFDLDAQFRYDLPEAYPILFLICPIMMRLRTMVLTKDASSIIAWFHREATPSGSWLSTCRIYLSHLTSHITTLTGRLAESKVVNDNEYVLSLRYSAIISYTTLAQLAYTLGLSSAPGTASTNEFRHKCCSALKRVIALVEEFQPEELQLIDPFLGAYWSRAHCLFTQNERPSFSDPSTAEGTTRLSSASTSFNVPMFRSPDEADLQAQISRVAELNETFLKNRFTPGTTSLCEMLAAHTTDRRPMAGSVHWRDSRGFCA